MRHKRTSCLRPVFLLFLSCLLVSLPKQSWGDTTDIASVEQMLKADKGAAFSFSYFMHLSPPPDTGTLDMLAGVFTKILCPNNGVCPDSGKWSPENPKWKPVYDRVRADFEAEMPTITAAINETGQKANHDYAVDVAAQIAQSDVDTLLSYYKSSQGQRYQDFMNRVDQIANPAKDQATMHLSPPTQKILTPEQQDRCFRMLVLSHFLQGLGPAMYDARFGDTVGSVHRWVDINQQEMAALDKKYAADLPDFEAFVKTDAYQGMLKATSAAIQTFRTQAKEQLNNNVDPARDALLAIRQKHENEWKAFYKAQMASP